MMKPYIIKIEWQGPFSANYVIKKKNDPGDESDGYAGPDYGLYQIYGRHILCKDDTLLYIGKACQQTFSGRFKQHWKEWLKEEKNIRIYLGKIENFIRYTEANSWRNWLRDVDMAESILIYKYSPNYNSACLGELPDINPYKEVFLLHLGNNHRLKKKDYVTGTKVK